ncbi:MAG: hypothetical protein ACKPI8_03780 [Microcystis panniformis]
MLLKKHRRDKFDPSVVSYQLSVISYQLSVISYQLSGIKYKMNVGWVEA